MDSNERSLFQIGDRVQVTDAWLVKKRRGAIGTIIEAHDGVPDLRDKGVYWVAFDGRLNLRRNGSFTDSAEIDADFLRHLKVAPHVSGLTIKVLLRSVALIAAGFFVFLFTLKTRYGDPNMILWHGAGALAGAGLLLPFRHPWLGALLGCVEQFLFLYWLYSRAF